MNDFAKTKIKFINQLYSTYKKRLMKFLKLLTKEKSLKIVSDKVYIR